MDRGLVILARDVAPDPARLTLSLPLRVVLYRGRGTKPLSRLETDLFLLHAGDPCRVIANAEAIETVWGDDEDGGPYGIVSAVGHAYWRLAQKLEPIGLTFGIEKSRGRWLIPLAQEMAA